MPILIDKYGLGISQARSDSKSTPLHYVATYAEEKDSRQAKATAVNMADILIKAGADMHALDLNGGTPLHHAFGFGSIRMVNFLIDAGADQTITDRNNKTPFDMIQSYRGNPFFGSAFYQINKFKFTKNLRVVRGSWENGKRILMERDRLWPYKERQIQLK